MAGFTSNESLETYPLRIPPDLQGFFQEKGLQGHQRPKRRSDRQLQPGVYSCGHQVGR